MSVNILSIACKLTHYLKNLKAFLLLCLMSPVLQFMIFFCTWWYLYVQIRLRIWLSYCVASWPSDFCWLLCHFCPLIECFHACSRLPIWCIHEKVWAFLLATRFRHQYLREYDTALWQIRTLCLNALLLDAIAEAVNLKNIHVYCQKAICFPELNPQTNIYSIGCCLLNDFHCFG